MIDFNRQRPPSATRTGSGAFTDWAGETWNDKITGKYWYLPTRDEETFFYWNEALITYGTPVGESIGEQNHTLFMLVQREVIPSRDPIDHRSKLKVLSTMPEEDDRPFKED